LGGRPKKIFDQRMFEELCELQCTKDEICAILDCDEKTLTRWCKEIYNEGFSDIYKSKSACGRKSLRRYQFNLAKTSAAMAIWLGKQQLGQVDKQQIRQQINITDDPITKAIKNGV